MLDVELVHITLNGVTKPWLVFVEYVVSCEHMPTWDHIWDYFIQEYTYKGHA